MLTIIYECNRCGIKLKVYIPLFLLILLVLSTAGCVYVNSGNENITKNYTGYNVSFNYTGDYELSIDPEGQDGYVTLDLYKGGPVNQSSLSITLKPNIYRSKELAIEKEKLGTVLGMNKVSNNTMIIDNETAYVEVYEGRLPPLPEVMTNQYVILVKNDTIYIFNIMVPKEEFDKEKPKYDVVLNSFRATNTG